MSDTSELKLCPKCGGSIPAEAPQGLCPKCLFAQAAIPTEAGKEAASKSAPPTQEDLAAAFPQLEIMELIGQGGMGFVFKARQPKLERLVALKILPQSLAADPAFAERFTREGRMLARLNHPNIVTIHDFGQANGFFYILMEFVDGVNLRQAMRVGRFTPEQALAVVPKICEALQFAHNEGILHRDIKPENILLDAKGRVKIADFGIAKLVGEPHADSSLTASDAVLGTPRYMAPEQLEKSGHVDHRADIYSLGVVFYEMLTGELPLGKFQPPSQKVRVDVRLDEVVLHALEKEPARRYQQASQVKTAVDIISASGPSQTGARPVLEPVPAGSGPDRFWRRFAVAAAVVVLGMILIPVLAILLGILVPALQKAKARAVAVPPPVEASSTQSAAPIRTFEASAETWSPTLVSNEKPDLQKVRDEAKELMAKHRYEEALQRQIWYYNHALEYDPGQAAVRLSFALSDWIELGRRYPKAREALTEIRDRWTRKFQDGRGWSEAFQEVASLNDAMQDDDATYALFKDINEKDPHLARQCYFYAEGLLVRKGDYQMCLNLMGDPLRRFELIRLTSGMDRIRTNTWTTPETLEMMKKSANDRFVGEVRELVEILVGTAHKADAEKIRDQALTVLGDARLKSAISDAEQRVGKKNQRIPELVIDIEPYTVAHPEPGEQHWGFKGFVPPGHLASILFVRWLNGVPTIEPGFSAYYKVGKAGGIDVPFCSLSCNRGPDSIFAGMTEAERIVGGYTFPESAGLTNAVRWNVNLGLGFTTSFWMPTAPYHRAESELPMKVRSGHQRAFRLVDFDRPEGLGTRRPSGVELRILLQPLNSSLVRTVPTEIDRTNYIAGSGIAGTMEEALEAMKEVPLDP